MTRKEIYQALADGKQMQWYSLTGAWLNIDDIDVCDRIVRSPGDEKDFLRIKPTRKRVPLGPEDVPPGSVLSWDCCGWYMVTCITDGRVMCGAGLDYSYEDLGMNHAEISRDGGKTWTQCSKEEPCDS